MKVPLLLLLPFAEAFNSYLDLMLGGGLATMKPSAFAVSGGKPKAPVGVGPASYLENISSAPTTVTKVPPARPVIRAPPAVASSSTAPIAGGYLSSLPTSSAPSGSGPVGYLDALRTESSVAGSGISGYLDAIGEGGSAIRKSSYVPTESFVTKTTQTATGPVSVENNAVLNAIEDLSSNMRRHQHATIDILKEISANVKILVEKSEAKAFLG